MKYLIFFSIVVVFNAEIVEKNQVCSVGYTCQEFCKTKDGKNAFKRCEKRLNKTYATCMAICSSDSNCIEECKEELKGGKKLCPCFSEDFEKGECENDEAKEEIERLKLEHLVQILELEDEQVLLGERLNYTKAENVDLARIVKELSLENENLKLKLDEKEILSDDSDSLEESGDCENTEYVVQLNDLVEINMELEEERDKAPKEVEECKNEKSENSEEFKKLRKESKHWTKEKEKSADVISDLKEEKNKLEEEKDELEEEISKLKDERKKLKRSNKDLLGEVEDLKEDVQDVTEELDHLKSELEECQVEKEENMRCRNVESASNSEDYISDDDWYFDSSSSSSDSSSDIKDSPVSYSFGSAKMNYCQFSLLLFIVFLLVQ